MAIKNVFMCTIPSCSFYFKNGTQAAFINGKYVTDVDWQIQELREEIRVPGVGKSQHPHIYIDQNEEEIDTEALSPVEAIKRQAVADYIAQQKLAMNPDNDRGNSDTSKFSDSLNNTRNMAETAAESTGDAGAAVAGSSAGGASITGTPVPNAVVSDVTARLASLSLKK